MILSKKKNHEHDGDNEILTQRRYNETYIKLAKERIIFISEDITNELAAELSAMLLYYDHQDNNELIEMYVNSDGGAATGLINIYDVMQMISSPIKTVCIGKCYSAAAVILAAGTKGQRFALKNSQVMIHGLQFGFPIPGHDITNSKNYFQFIKENNDMIMKMLSKHTGNNLEKVKEDCLRDVWMTSVEALSYGIVDYVI